MSSLLADLKLRHRQVERALLVVILGEAGWNVSAAARRLGISRVGLTKKLKATGLKRPERSEGE